MSQLYIPQSHDPREQAAHSVRIGYGIVFVISLILLTTSLLLWQHFGMDVELKLSAASNHGVELAVIDDRAQQGETVATLERGPKTVVLNCDLRPKFHLPYCGYQFILSHNDQGVDLSKFDSISLDLDYQSPGRRYFRLFVHNFEPGRSSLQDYMSQKIAEVRFDLPRQGIFNMPVTMLQTAHWWIELRNTPLSDTEMRIDNVTSIDLLVGSPETIGHHRVALRSIKFHGKLIRQNTLLLFLVAVWILFGLVWLANALMRYRSQLRNSSSRLALLSQINSALELETRELAGQVYHDPLTGALNRQGLRDGLVNKWRNRGALGEPMAVVFVDLDHFKLVNDTHGHATGDEVLRTFAMSVQRDIRPTDKLVRWGGEEFLIICLGTGGTEAQGLAEKLRAAMLRQVWPCGLQMTASFGVTALQPCEEIGEAIKRADSALYRAKASGRNCVLSA